jgi:hypothetical protein
MRLGPGVSSTGALFGTNFLLQNEGKIGMNTALSLEGHASPKTAPKRQRVHVATFYAVTELSRTTGDYRLFLLVLARWADDAGECWPSQLAIAKAMNRSLRWIRELQNDLIAAGELKLLDGLSAIETNRLRILCMHPDFKPSVIKRKSKGPAKPPRHKAQKVSADKETDIPLQNSVPISVSSQEPFKNQGETNTVASKQQPASNQHPAVSPPVEIQQETGDVGDAVMLQTADPAYPAWYFKPNLSFTKVQARAFRNRITVGLYPKPPRHSPAERALRRWS